MVIQRFNNDNNYDDQGYASDIAFHYNSDSHLLYDFRFQPIDLVNYEMSRLHKNTYWTNLLDTLHSKGPNSRVCYDIK